MSAWLTFPAAKETKMIEARVRLQIAEAMGPVNRWYCSQAYGRPVTEQEKLLCYFIKSGGAADFARRFDQAMGAHNRWYCSEYYGFEVSDPEMLWKYYTELSPIRRSRSAVAR